MGRFFAALLLALMLLPAPGHSVPQGERMFFSMLFPHLIPGCLMDGGAARGADADGAVML